MPINIHGKMYNTVAERLESAKPVLMGVETEVLIHNPVVIKATIVTDRGSFTGISAANASKQIEKESPYEVAETSAVGRALAFAGFGTTDSIASVEEMKKAGVASPTAPQQTKPTNTTSSSPAPTKYAEQKIVTFKLQDKTLGTSICNECGGHMVYFEGIAKTTGKPWSKLMCEGDNNHVAWYPKVEKATNWNELNELPIVIADIDPADVEAVMPF